jgi:4-amino-4-deoxy-L-arabinose transferase-like glycosyltransferase
MEQFLETSDKQEISSTKLWTSSSSQEWVVLPSCIFFTLLIRLIFIPQNTVINGDGIYYATLGKKLLSGDLTGGISAYWSPLYSFLVGFSSLFFNDLEFAGRIVSIIAGTLLIFPSYLLIKNLFGQVPAYYAIILLTVHPLLVKSSVWVMTESLYTLVFTTGVLFAWYSLRSGKYHTFFFTGLVFGAAYLTKPEAIGFIGLLFILMICAKYFRRTAVFRHYLVGYLILLSGFASIFLPYIIYLHEKTGDWTISQKIMVNFPAADYDGDFLKLIGDKQMTMQDRIWGDDYGTEIRQNAELVKVPSHSNTVSSSIWSKVSSTVSVLGLKAFGLFEKQIKDYIPELIPYVFILVAIVGVFYKPWTKTRAAKELFLFSFFICTLIGYALSTVELRYLFPLIPILIGWVANGIVGVSEWATESLERILGTKTKINQLIFQLSTLIFLSILLLTSFAIHFKPNNVKNIPSEEKDAGLWIKSHSKSTSELVVMSSHATAAFYAEAKHLFVPDEEFPTVLEYARKRKANYLIFSQRRAENTLNAFPADNQDLPEDIKIVYQNNETPDYRLIVYQIFN